MEVFLGYTVATIAFLLGPALASYFTVLVMRGENLTKASGPFSVDDRTGERLKWYELIPIISFLWQRGRSRYTGKPLDLRMFLAEVVGSIAFGIFSFGAVDQLLSAYASSDFSMFAYLLNFLVMWVFLAGMLYLAIYDLFTYSIPTKFTYYLSGAAVGVNLVFGLLKWLPGSELSSIPLGNFDNLLAGLIAGAAVWAVIRLTKQKGMGEGDVYIAVILGLMLGGAGLVAAFYTTVFSGTIVGLFLMWQSKKLRGLIVPLVPFMLFGFAAGAMWGKTIVNLLFAGLL